MGTYKVTSAILLIVPFLKLCYTQDMPPQFSGEANCGTPVPENNLKILTCYAFSQPAATYRWLRNGLYITNSSVSGTKTIQNINRNDAGEYRCQAENRLGSILSSACQVIVAYLDPFTTTSPVDNVAVTKGDAVKLALPPIISFPPPNVEWYRDNQVLAKDGPRHQVTLDNDLVILETQLAEDDNQYKATALNGQTGGFSDTHVYTLKVSDSGSSLPIPPSFIVTPKDTTVNQGELSVSFECIANARPVSDMITKWYRIENGQRNEIQASEKYLMNAAYKRQLLIKNPDRNDNGVYECEASLTTNSISYPVATAQANLTVYEKPAIISSLPQQITKDFSQSINLECKAAGIPTPTIHWYFNSREVTTLSSPKHHISENGTLTIDRLDMNDMGMYQCFARNAAGESKKYTLIRVNSAPPNIVSPPSNLTIVAGLDARFPCKAEGAPQPLVEWKKETSQGQVPVVGGGRYQILADNELSISTTEPGDSGHYICMATNSMGSQSAEAFLSVLIKTQITRPPSNVTTIKGSTAEMSCGVSSDPNVLVTWWWYHYDSSNGPRQNVTQSARHTVAADGTLTITGVYNIDIGRYECQVVSIGGNDSRTAYLQVTELPHKPVITSTNLDSVDLKSVNITWSPGFSGNSPVNRFIVQYRKVVYVTDKGIVEAEDWVVKEGQVSPTRRWYVVSGLRPARYFQFRVSAVNDVGEGPFSDAKPFPPILMPEQAPSSPPKGFYGSPRSNTSIMLQWQLPSEDSWNGDLLGYMIRYKLAGYPDQTYQSINTTNYLVTTYELTNLVIFQEYEIQIAAYNSKGVGVFTDSIKEWTMEGVPTRAPTEVKATSLNSTSVKIVWKPVDGNFLNGIALGFKVTASKVGSPASERVESVPPNPGDPYGQQTTFIHNLLKYTNYTFTVLCYTSKGDGPKSSPIVVQTAEDVPDAVESLAFTEVLDRSIKVVWTPPAHINGELQGYTVQWELKNVSSSRDQVVLGPTYLTYTVSKLSPTTKYTIYVFARTRVGAGPAKSADVESGVPPEAPHPPHNLGIADIQARSVLLQFLPGYDGKTSITTWIVEGQVGSDTTWSEIYRISDPPATSIVVRNLLPYTWYKLRIRAVNIVATSDASEPTRQFQTRQDSPSVPPSQVTVRSINSTALRVSWAPLSVQDWNGAPKGYKIFYRQDNASQWSLIEVDMASDSHILANLEEWMVYEVKMQSYNDVGSSDFSDIESERTRDAAPSKGPEDLSCETETSTSINCTWGDVPLLHQNGIVLGYKLKYTDPSNPPSLLDVPGSDTHTVTVTGLRKFVKYDLQIMAYTRIGDGVLSTPPIEVETSEDVPGPPMYLWFPDVTYNAADIHWSPPVEPNGVITGYMVSHRLENTNDAVNSSVLTEEQRSLKVISLQKEKYYVFSVRARTRMGWGAAAEARVYTQINRREPDSPTKPQITSEVQARAVTISWQSGFDGYGPLRNYTIQYKVKDGVWRDIGDTVPADLTSFTITGLHPNTTYSFRVAANNDIGRSPYSDQSDQVTTLQDKPEGAPKNLVVVPKTTDSVIVTWEQPDPATWNGNILGYLVQYRKQSMPDYQDKSVLHPTHSTILSNLDKYVQYEVQVLAFNSIGNGPHSIPTSVYVGVAAPSAPPSTVEPVAKNSTTLTVTWQPPPPDTQNGKLSGYKVSYKLVDMEGAPTKVAVVRENSIDLNKLEKFSNYSISVLAYNTYGDGPASDPKFERTEQWTPGAPRNLDFNNITMTSLNVSWQPPEKPNGVIIFYDLTYRSHADQRLVKLSNLSGIQHFYWISKLEENVTYTVTVVARTVIGPGPEIQQDVTTGPQRNLSPDPPFQPVVTVGPRNTLTVSWRNGQEGVSPILGYIIRARSKDIGEWRTVVQKHSPDPKVQISWPSYCSAGGCRFSVIAFNSKGISYPSPQSELISNLQVASAKPVYNEWWFLVIVALAGLVVILVIISLLCLVARNKNKDLKKSTANSMSTTTLDDGGFTSADMRQSHRSLARIGNGTLRSIRSREAPRPSPASVTYSEDLEGAKGPIPSDDDDDDDSSSVTRKPSDLGDDSTEPSDDESDVTDKPFPPPPPPAALQPPASPPPPPFTPNPYVNDGARRSWRNQTSKSNSNTNNYTYNPTYTDNYNSNYNAYSYTDSEADSSHYAFSLNSGRIIMNNAAGSRAPLPGFSSFV